MELVVGIFGGAILTVAILGLYCSLVLSAEQEKYGSKKSSKKGDKKNARK